MTDTPDREELYRLVTGAILLVESFADQYSTEARDLYAHVSRLEEQIADLSEAGTIEGTVARRGAVRAAMQAGDVSRATDLRERYKLGARA